MVAGGSRHGGGLLEMPRTAPTRCRLFGGNDQESAGFTQSEAESARSKQLLSTSTNKHRTGTGGNPRFQIPRSQVRFLPGALVRGGI